jgi:hypothetical protein
VHTGANGTLAAGEVAVMMHRVALRAAPGVLPMVPFLP